MTPRTVRVGSGLVLASMALALGACGGGEGGGETHALGDEAPVRYAERDEKGALTGVRTRIGLTVLAVRRGTQEELEAHGFEVDADARDTTPYYVDARWENEGRRSVKRNLEVSLEDSEGNLIGRTIVFNYGNKPFEPCVEVSEGTVKPEESYESCTLFLVEEGVEVGRVSFLSDSGPEREPEFVSWEVK